MAKKFSELPAASTLTGAEIVPVVQGGVTKQTTLGTWATTLPNLGLAAGALISGDFSTFPTRTTFRSSVSNGRTDFDITPNGAAQASGVVVWNGSDRQNASAVFLGLNGATATNYCFTIGAGVVPTSYIWGVTASVSWAMTSSGTILPGSDNGFDLGSSSLRPRQIYAANATINTSDAREKTPVRQLNTNESAAAKALAAEIGIYQFLNSIDEKGEDGARLHAGMTVQRAIEVMEAHGLDPMRYGFICYDEWPEHIEEIEDDDGDQVRIVQQQATIETPVESAEIEVIDGVPTLVSRTTMQRTPATELRAVVAEDGTAVLGEDEEPLMYPVPVMEDVEQRFRRVVTPAGNRYSFRETRLILFILAGITESL